MEFSTVKYVLNKVQTFLKLISIKKNEWKWFGLIFTLCFVWYFIPDISAFFLGRNKIKFISHAYDFSKELFLALVGSMFYYLMVESLIARSKTKNELDYSIFQYKLMKKTIFVELIRSQYKGFIPEDENGFSKDFYNNPIEAQKYFTKEVLWDILDKLDQDSLNKIIRAINKFLEESKEIKYHFIQYGNFSLVSAFNVIEEKLRDIERLVESEARFMDWTEDLNLKSCNVFYTMFCQEFEGEDPILKILLNIAEDYN